MRLYKVAYKDRPVFYVEAAGPGIAGIIALEVLNKHTGTNGYESYHSPQDDVQLSFDGVTQFYDIGLQAWKDHIA